MKWIVALVLGANGLVLWGVYSNRSAGPTATIELTERELYFDPQDRENTGVFLQLQWQRTPFEAARRLPPRTAFVAFDYRPEQPAERPADSRLFPVDASTDEAGLRRKCPGCLVLPARVRFREPPSRQSYVTGVSVSQIYVPREHRSKFDTLGRVSSWQHLHQRDKPDAQPRYSVTLHYGSRHEPWVADVRMR